MYCGKTNHLTSFSILLEGNGGSSTEDYIIAWVSLGVVGLAIIYIAIAVVLIELRYQKKRHEVTDKIKKISTYNSSET